MEKISSLLLKIFGTGVLFALLAGAVAFVGYMIALLIGGETATEICLFIYEKFFPVVIRICSVSVGCGLLAMYLSKVSALSLSTGKDKNNS